MSYSFTVSTLSSIQRLDTPALLRSLRLPADTKSFAYSPAQAQPFEHGSSPDEVMDWWRATQDTHIRRLKTPVQWDETSKVEVSRYLYAGQDLELCNLLTYLDQVGTEAVAFSLRTHPPSQYGDDTELLKAANARGFAMRFPQAMIAPELYLPFGANIILEVVDWRGQTSRFGSLPNLTRKLAEVLTLIENSGPRACPDQTASFGSEKCSPKQRLERVWCLVFGVSTCTKYALVPLAPDKATRVAAQPPLGADVWEAVRKVA